MRAPVLWVDPPVSGLFRRRQLSTLCSTTAPPLPTVAANVRRLTPSGPPGLSRPGLRELSAWSVRRQIARAIRIIGLPVHAVVAASLTNVFDVADGALKVFYGTDDFVAGSELMGVSPRYQRKAEQRQLRKADVTVAISPVLAEKWQSAARRVVMIPNGCDPDAYSAIDQAPLPTDVRLTAPVAGLVGHVSDRIDLSLLEAVARRRISLLLVGPRPRTARLDQIERLLALPNVQWVGPKPFHVLPSYLRVIDVGLTPYATSSFNLASFPLKTLEYLAAGRGVVATELPATRWLDTDLISVASTPQQFADAVENALATPRTRDLVSRRRALAEQHSWRRRSDEFADLLGLVAVA